MSQPLVQEPGVEIAHRYRLVEKVGEGGAGQVWRAAPLAGGPDVALKLLHEVTDKGLRSRLVHEARAAATLESPHVVRILDVGEDATLPFIAMELLEGQSLEQRLAQGPLAPRELWTVMADVGLAVGLAHEHGIVHRDLKPANIFLTERGPVKVLDFGIAKLSKELLGGATPQTRTGDQLGTPRYMSPEQLRSSKAVDYRSDLWSLAVLAYHGLLGKPPFRAKKYGELVLAICLQPIPKPSSEGTVPQGFDAWFARATQRVPSDRFESSAAMMRALQPVLLG